jgi:hypothetical protein
MTRERSTASAEKAARKRRGSRRSRELSFRPAASPRWFATVEFLPPRVRALLGVLLLCGVAQAGLSAYGALSDPDGATVLGSLARQPTLAGALALALGLLALLILERPRSWSPRAYAAQLKERAVQVQTGFDGALRRRFREQEETADDPPSSPP